MNSGYKVYHMERYDGADSKVNEMDFFRKNTEMKMIRKKVQYT